MIRTRFGSTVELLGKVDSDGWVKVRREIDGATREWNVRDLIGDTPEDSAALLPSDAGEQHAN